MKALVLDTDACIEIIRGNPEPIRQYDDVVFMVSTVSEFEILSGLRGQHSSAKERRARQFLDVANKMPFDSGAAGQAALIRIELEGKGTPIGPYDLLLAGHAKSLSVPILTRNTEKFRRVTGLTVLDW